MAAESFKKVMVSIQMLTYKHGAYIKQSIDGALMQDTNFEFDLIVSDDCSPDNTQEIVEEIIKNHPKGYRIKYFRHKDNIGMQANGLFAFEKCQGKYIAICEGDDYWTDPSKLQKQVDFLELNPDYVFCVHRYKMYLENEKKYDEKTYPLNYKNYKEKDGGIEIDRKLFSKDWVTQPLTAVIVKEDLNEVLKKDYYFKYFRDYHIFYFLLQNGKGLCLSTCSGVYRVNDGGIASSKTMFEKIKIAFMIYEELYLYTKDYSILLNYCRITFFLVRKIKGLKIVFISFICNFSFNDKLVLLSAFLRFFLIRFLEKIRRSFNI